MHKCVYITYYLGLTSALVLYGSTGLKSLICNLIINIINFSTIIYYDRKKVRLILAELINNPLLKFLLILLCLQFLQLSNPRGAFDEATKSIDYLAYVETLPSTLDNFTTKSSILYVILLILFSINTFYTFGPLNKETNKIGIVILLCTFANISFLVGLLCHFFNIEYFINKSQTGLELTVSESWGFFLYRNNFIYYFAGISALCDLFYCKNKGKVGKYFKYNYLLQFLNILIFLFLTASRTGVIVMVALGVCKIYSLLFNDKNIKWQIIIYLFFTVSIFIAAFHANKLTKRNDYFSIFTIDGVNRKFQLIINLEAKDTEPPSLVNLIHILDNKNEKYRNTDLKISYNRHRRINIDYKVKPNTNTQRIVIPQNQELKKPLKDLVLVFEPNMLTYKLNEQLGQIPLSANIINKGTKYFYKATQPFYKSYTGQYVKTKFKLSAFNKRESYNQLALKQHNSQIYHLLESRLYLIYTSFKIFRDNLLFGTGAGTWKFAYLFYREPDATWENWAHCDVIQFLCEYGLLGFVTVFLSVSPSVHKVCRIGISKVFIQPPIFWIHLFIAILSASSEFSFRVYSIALVYIVLFYQNLSLIRKNLP